MPPPGWPPPPTDAIDWPRAGGDDRSRRPRSRAAAPRPDPASPRTHQRGRSVRSWLARRPGTRRQTFETMATAPQEGRIRRQHTEGDGVARVDVAHDVTVMLDARCRPTH